MINWPIIITSFPTGLFLMFLSAVRYIQQGQEAIVRELAILVGLGFVCLVIVIAVLLVALFRPQRSYTPILAEPKSLIGVQSQAKLFDILTDRLTAEEWRTIVFDLKIKLDWDTGAVESKMARDVLVYLENRGEMVRLGAWLANNRPDIEL